MVKYGLCIGSHEERLQMLRVQQLAIQQDMSTLQASMDIIICSSLGSKDEIMERIECSKDDSAAAAVCKIMRMPSNEFGEQVLGVVALLGTVDTNNLSRILAEYLGEDQMLAVVCKSYVTASFLERYDRNGNVNHALALYKMARDIGKSIKGRYHVICLENIRPYAGELGSDPQRKLALSDPTLPNGMTPPGYLGYAVNMIYLEDVHLCMRTASGHGLRETLFYHLFGELQVYETREHIKMAHPFINEGAVSFDGGILRGNGLLSLGCWEPEIQFPVMNPSSPRHCSQQSVETMMQMEAGKSKLKETRVEIEKETKSYQKTLKKFNKVKDSYTKFLDKKGPLLGSLEYRPITNGLYNSPSH